MDPFGIELSAPRLPLRATAQPSLRSDFRRIRGETWERSGHRPMKRRRVQSSRIWEHGDEYTRIEQEEGGAYWICDHCDQTMTLSRSQSTSNILRHLREEHQVLPPPPINWRRDEGTRGTSSNSVISRSSSDSQERTSSSVLSLTHRVDINEFRNLLIRWIVQQQVPHFAVDQQEFRDLLYYLAPGLKDTLSTSHTTIGRWVQAEYRAAKAKIKELLANSLSKVHLSFDRRGNCERGGGGCG
jgi:hypothetical protein